MARPGLPGINHFGELWGASYHHAAFAAPYGTGIAGIVAGDLVYRHGSVASDDCGYGDGPCGHLVAGDCVHPWLSRVAVRCVDGVVGQGVGVIALRLRDRLRG